LNATERKTMSRLLRKIDHGLNSRGARTRDE
jgi:hypothetical protein